MFDYLGVFDEEIDFMLEYYPAGSPIPRNVQPKGHRGQSGEDRIPISD